MGYNFAAILAAKSLNKAFRDCPQHDSFRAQEIIEDLRLTAWSGRAEASFRDALTLRQSSAYALGSYREVVFYSDRELFGSALAEENKLLQKFVKGFQEFEVFYIELVDTVSLFGFSLYERGILRRAMQGSPDEGLIVDFGSSLEDEVFAARSKKDRIKVLNRHREKFLSDLRKGGFDEGLDANDPMRKYGMTLFDINSSGRSIGYGSELANRLLEKYIGPIWADRDGPLWNLKLELFEKSSEHQIQHHI